MKQVKEIYDKFLKPKANVCVGLDIGNSSVKIVQLEVDPKTKEKQITGFDISRFKSSKKDDIVKSLKEAVRGANIANTAVNTSVSGQAVIVRYIQMPKMTKEELTKALKLGVGKYIPFNLDEVNFDFQILGRDAQSDKMMRVLLVAVKKEIIQERINILKEAGLTPNIIDVDSFAIVNSFQLVRQASEGIIAVLDIGADITSTTILKENTPQFNRDIPIGGKHLTRAITEEFEMTDAEADLFKHEPGDKYGDLITAIKPVLDSLGREIHMSFNYAEGQLGGVVQKIFLTGGTAKFKGIDKILNSILGMDVEVWDPTKILKVHEGIEKERLMGIGPLLSVSVGLALRG